MTLATYSRIPPPYRSLPASLFALRWPVLPFPVAVAVTRRLPPATVVDRVSETDVVGLWTDAQDLSTVARCTCGEFRIVGVQLRVGGVQACVAVQVQLIHRNRSAEFVHNATKQRWSSKTAVSELDWAHQRQAYRCTRTGADGRVVARFGWVFVQVAEAISAPLIGRCISATGHGRNRGERGGRDRRLTEINFKGTAR